MVDRTSNEEMTMTMSGRSAAATAPAHRFTPVRGIALLFALLALLGAALAVTAATAVPASAATKEEIEEELGFEIFNVEPSNTQAGGHPDLLIDTQWVSGGPFSGGGPLPSMRRLKIHTPTGFIGNPHVTPKCTLTELSSTSCPTDAQLGIVGLPTLGIGLFFPLYNMETRPDQPGLMAFTTPLLNAPVFLDLVARTDSDYGLTTITSPQLKLGINAVRTTLWGVPADPKHDKHRFLSPLQGFGACLNEANGCPGETFATASIPERPFLQNPTTCGTELISRGDVEYFGGYLLPGEDPFPPTTGCQQLSFSPSFLAKPTTDRSDSPTGLDMTITVPQSQSGKTPAPSELRTSRITLPEGFTINPNAADGKVACPDIATRIGTLFAAECPEFSKVATIVLDVAALPTPIPGAIYLAEPKPGEPYRIVLAADGFSTHIKLLGSVRADPQTGQVTLVLEDLPQSPLQEFNLHVFGSERGLFASPPKCGHVPTNSEFVPWDDELLNSRSTDFMDFTSGPNGTPCPGATRPYAPSVTTGVANNAAGMHSPFSITLNRGDGDQNTVGLDVSTAPGFAATLKGIPYCPEAAIDVLNSPSHTGKEELASPACPAASQIGTANTGTGAGTHPLYTPGGVYLAGPYKGAPLSLVVAVPAVSGPYDLGNVVVRSAIFVDPVTARVTTVSDSIPQILEGIPLRIRSILVDLDRPGFTLNPTDCSPFSVDTTAFGSEGAQSVASNHFQVANCANLDFGPKLALKLTGSTKRRGHPALRAILRTGAGEANLARTEVVMPKNELLDNSHIRTVCTRVQFASDSCPADSIYGSATAESPLLDAPLSGPVYLRSSSHKLPDLVADLHGQIDLEVSGQIDSVNGGALRARFETIPDAPVSKFVLDMRGGSKGLLQNSRPLCKANRKASVELSGQNGMKSDRQVPLQAACGSKTSRHKRHLRRLYRSRVVH
jgi:hypothetical protein